MAYYAFIDDNNVVTEVISGKDEDQMLDGLTPEEWYGNFRGQRCVRTSFNGRIRKQYAGIGFTYNEEADVFVSPQPYPSWSLDKNYDWQPPVPNPGGPCYWSEETLSWLPLNAG
jgi:hypothetical protein